MKTLIVEFTDDQYNRFKAAFAAQTVGMIEATDEDLATYLKQCAKAITFSAEVTSANQAGWEF